MTTTKATTTATRTPKPVLTHMMENEMKGTASRRTGRKAVAAVAVAAGTLAWLVASPSTAEATRQPVSAVNWQPCPAYSDDVIRAKASPTNGYRSTAPC